MSDRPDSPRPADTGPACGSPPGRSFGPTVPQALLNCVGRVTGVLGGAATVWLVNGTVPLGFLIGWSSGSLVASAAFWPWLRKQGVTITPYTVAVRRGYRTTRASWAHVHSVDVQRNTFGTRRIVLVTLDEGTLKPPWPNTSLLVPDPTFPAKADAVRAAWVAYHQTHEDRVSGTAAGRPDGPAPDQART